MQCQKKSPGIHGDSNIGKIDKAIDKREDITVCLPGAKIEDVAEWVGEIMGGGMGGSVLVHVGTNNAEKKETSAMIGKHRRLVKMVGHGLVKIVLSGILVSIQKA